MIGGHIKSGIIFYLFIKNFIMMNALTNKYDNEVSGNQALFTLHSIYVTIFCEVCAVKQVPQRVQITFKICHKAIPIFF